MGLLLLLLTLAAGLVVFLRPPALMRDLTWGQLFIPFAGDGRWLTPVGVATVVALVLLVAWCWWAPRPLLDLRGWLGGAARGRPRRAPCSSPSRSGA